MANVGRMTVELEVGPAMRTALDVLEFAAEAMELIPEWHVAERKELQSRCQALFDVAMSILMQHET